MWEKIICNSNPTTYEHELWQHPKMVTRNSTYTNNLKLLLEVCASNGFEC
jgi:hypothetical protein